MAQEKVFIAVRSDQLSQPGDARYVIKNRETHEVVDDNSGRGYKSPPPPTPASHSNKDGGHQRRSTPLPRNASIRTRHHHSLTANNKKTIFIMFITLIVSYLFSLLFWYLLLYIVCYVVRYLFIKIVILQHSYFVK